MSSEVTGYAILHLHGADAGDFLRAQLTLNPPLTHEEGHVLAAWCDAKGRAVCTLRIVAIADGFLLILPADLAQTIQQRLRMYILRAQVEVRDATAHWHLSALPGTADAAETKQVDGIVSSSADGDYRLQIDTGGGPGEVLLSAGTPDANALPLDSAAWQLAEIDAGLPEIAAATAGMFVPQMLNLHWLGGIDFHKGCYPGQEVIARLHFRGRLTRRLFRMAWQGQQPAPGDDITDAAGKRQGSVLRAGAAATGHGRLLAVLRIDSADTALHCDAAELSLLDLPYATEAATTADG